MTNWLVHHSTAMGLWFGALCTFAIYSILYKENKFYRLFEHIFIGLSAGYGVYVTWSEVLKPKWWTPMVAQGQWWWAFALVIGSMFYFMYSRRHAWISRVIFSMFMGFAAGGVFREFYEGVFPQIGSSFKPIAGSAAAIASVVIFYIILLASMSYFFFSFEHKHPVVTTTAKAGRWFLMIGFGAMFGATVMGRMTLFIGRLNFLIHDWGGELGKEAHYTLFKILVPSIILLIGAGIAYYYARPHAKKPEETE